MTNNNRMFIYEIKQKFRQIILKTTIIASCDSNRVNKFLERISSSHDLDISEEQKKLLNYMRRNIELLANNNSSIEIDSTPADLSLQDIFIPSLHFAWGKRAISSTDRLRKEQKQLTLDTEIHDYMRVKISQGFPLTDNLLLGESISFVEEISDILEETKSIEVPDNKDRRYYISNYIRQYVAEAGGIDRVILAYGHCLFQNRTSYVQQQSNKLPDFNLIDRLEQSYQSIGSQYASFFKKYYHGKNRVPERYVKLVSSVDKIFGSILANNY